LTRVAQDYIDTKTMGRRTRIEVTRYLRGPYFRPLHPVAISDITRADVVARVRAVGKASGNPTANRALSALSAMLGWAVKEGFLETNPCIGANRQEENAPRERVLTDQELTAIWKACSDCGDYGKIVRLLMLTGCRREEVRGIALSELNDETGCWTLPASRSKNGRALTLPLPELAWSIIRSVPREPGVDTLFLKNDWARGKRALDGRLAGKVEPWCLHDLRRTCATRMADLGIAPHIIEAVLNHWSGHRRGVAGVYNRSPYEREVAAALALWADRVQELTEGRSRKVVKMRPRRARAEAEAS
jgi:integrase